MRHVILSFLCTSFLFSSVLEDRVTTKAQTACYLKNPSNGLTAGDYAPTIVGQTLLQDLNSNTDSDGCQSWIDNPYVNIDTETYNVIAEMSCDIVSTTENGVTTNERTIKQYSLTVQCNAQCEIPKDNNGINYERSGGIFESDCTVVNLQQLINTYSPDAGYIIDDTQYLNCTTNPNLSDCYYKKHVDFGDNNSTDNNATDSNTTNNIDLTGTNSRLDNLNDAVNNLGAKIDENGQKLNAIGTKLDVNGLKIDSVRDAVIESGNYLGVKIDAMGNIVVSELQSQGDRLHADLQALHSTLDTSDNFDDSGIIDAIQQNTEAINEIKDLNEGEADTDTGFFSSYESYYTDMQRSIDSVENNVNDLMATIQGDYTPQFQSHNSCTISFLIMGKIKSFNMCKYSSMLRPFFTFILTIAMLVLLIRIHFYLFPKVFKSD